jgi:hypothetical protein
MSNGYGRKAWRLAQTVVLLALFLVPPLAPAAQSQAPGYVQASAGLFHSCAIQQYFFGEGGAVECWGLNDDGQASPPAGAFTQVSAGGYHTCALDPDGRVTCWGSNRVFTRCDEFDCYYEDTWQATPPEGVFFKQVSAGLNHTCGIKLDDSIDCWGHNSAGETADRTGPYLQVSAGENHTCALRTDRQVECWGDNAKGRAESKIGPFTFISAGGSHNCAIRQDNGKLECWGGDGYGQSSPPDLAFAQVSAGNLHTCGTRADSDWPYWVVCWGYNFYGQVKQAPDGNFKQIDSGQGHSCGVTFTNELFCWGRNDHGQTKIPNLGNPSENFAWEGFYPPVEAEPALNAVKAGSAVPLKFSLGGDYGLNVIEADSPASQPLDCALLDPSGELEPAKAAGKGLAYDMASGQYTYVWKTEKGWAGTCRVLSLRLVDGTEHLAAFRFR